MILGGLERARDALGQISESIKHALGKVSAAFARGREPTGPTTGGLDASHGDIGEYGDDNAGPDPEKGSSYSDADGDDDIEIDADAESMHVELEVDCDLPLTATAQRPLKAPAAATCDHSDLPGVKQAHFSSGQQPGQQQSRKSGSGAYPASVREQRNKTQKEADDEKEDEEIEEGETEMRSGLSLRQPETVATADRDDGGSAERPPPWPLLEGEENQEEEEKEEEEEERASDSAVTDAALKPATDIR